MRRTIGCRQGVVCTINSLIVGFVECLQESEHDRQVCTLDCCLERFFHTMVAGNDGWIVCAHVLIYFMPRHLLVCKARLPAYKDVEGAKRFESHQPNILVRAINTDVVGSAVSYVYGDDDGQLRFVQNNMGKRIYEPMFKRLQKLHEESGLGGREIVGVDPLWQYQPLVEDSLS